MEPGMLPRKASIQLMDWPVATLLRLCAPPALHCASGVAPEKPSAEVHTRSPEICAG